MQRVRAYGAALVVATLGAACAQAPLAGENSAQTLRVAVVSMEVGAAEFGGLSRTRAVQHAVDDINEAGGVLGNPVDVSVHYTGAAQERVHEAVTEALASGAAAMIGPDNSAQTFEVLDEVVAAPALVCGPNATADALSTYPDDGFYFRTAPPDRYQGPLLAGLIAERGAEPVTLFVQQGPYGEGLAASVATGLRERDVAFSEVLFSPDAKDAPAAERALVATSPAAIAVLSHIGPVLGALAQLGLGPRDLPVFVSDGLAVDEVFQHIDPSDPGATQGMLGVKPGHAADHPEDELVQRVASGHFTAQAYDCAILIALAAEAAGSVDPAAIRDHMGEISRDGERCTTFATCVELVREGVDVDYDGVSGPVDFDEAGDPAVAVYHVLEFQQNGRTEVIERVLVP